MRRSPALPEPRPVTPALGELGARLRELRDAAGLTGGELAERLGGSWRPPKISKIENGRQLPTEAEIEQWAGATGGDVVSLADLRGRAAAGYRPNREQRARPDGLVAHQQSLADLAASSTFVGEFQPALVPGFLQTAAYMHGLAATEPLVAEGPDAAETQRLIAARLRRNAILHEPGREFVHVVTEAALRLRPGTTTVVAMRHQLSHLAELATVPGHTFGVVPFTVACPAPPFCFDVYDRDLVRVETAAGVLELTDAGSVARYTRWLDQLVDVALTGADAADFCRAVAATLPG